MFYFNKYSRGNVLAHLYRSGADLLLRHKERRWNNQKICVLCFVLFLRWSNERLPSLILRFEFDALLKGD